MFKKMNQIKTNGFHGGQHFVYALFLRTVFMFFVYKKHIEMRVV